jgi:hypothetical protein
MQPTFQEVQYAEAWVGVLLAFIGAVVPAGIVAMVWFLAKRASWKVRLLASVSVVVMFVAPCAAIPLFFGKMTTEVTASEVRVRFGWLPSYSESIPVAEILAIQAVQYDPVGEYGGWGIRGRGPANRALNQRGDLGVRLVLGTSQGLLIGSQQPEALAGAIAQVRQIPWSSTITGSR